MASGVYSIRGLESLDVCLRVVDLEKSVWQYPDAEDVVPAALLLVSVKRGGILLGAFEAGTSQLIGFVYSLPAIRDGQLTQWSHMLGVLPDRRGAGVGAALKRAQRTTALEMGIPLIEWSFDPLQVLNANLNFAVLGVISDEYAQNLYGASNSPLHRGTPTDRLIVQWHLDSAHVRRRLERAALKVRVPETLDAPAVIRVEDSGSAPTDVDTTRDERRVLVDVPAGFGDLVRLDPAAARQWRMATRLAFTAYLGRGYRAVDFFWDRPAGPGRYLLARE